MKSWQTHSLFRFASSLKLAVVSILSLAAVLAVATVFESLYGMRGAHAIVYGQLWFHGLLIMLGTNVFCAALSRWPWKRRQTGFVVTHAGILILLFGSWLTMEYGVDGNLPVVEGSADGQLILNDMRLTLSDAQARQMQAFPVRDSATRREGRLSEIYLPDGDTLVLSSYMPRARSKRVMVKSDLGIGVPAARVEIYNERFSIDEWLVAQDPDSASEVNLGPALLTLKKLWTAEQERAFREGTERTAPQKESKGYVVVELEGKEYRVEIDEAMKDWQPVGETGIQIHIDRYMPHAVVEKKQLVNRGKQPVNPSVQLTLRKSDTESEKHILFAHFPDFQTRHQKIGSEPEFGATLRMIASEPGLGGNVRGRLHFGQTKDGSKLLYRVEGKEGKTLSQGEVVVGEDKATGWMDLRFRVSEWVPAAIPTEQAVYVDRQQGSENFASAVEVFRERGGKPTGQKWTLIEGMSASVPIGDRVLDLAFTRERLTLPFQVALTKFTMQTDPGTTKAATYESDVVVRDPKHESAPTAHISMNEPLVYGGYTFYQASYQLRDGQPALSVFSVNFDPGRWVKYAGSLIMVLGILLMFVMNPHYWDILLGRKRAS